MALRRQVHHRIRLMTGEDLAHRRRIGDIRVHQDVTPVMPSLLQRVFGRGVGQLVHVDHDVIAVTDQVAHHGGPDEPASTGQQHLHTGKSFPLAVPAIGAMTGIPDRATIRRGHNRPGRSSTLAPITAADS